MDLCKSACAVAAINLRSWLKDTRIKFLFLCIGCYVIGCLWPLVSYGLQEDCTMTPWLLPVLFKSDLISVNLTKTILHIGMVLMLCNAPFLFPTTPYIVLRSRRKAWWMGECIYIIGAALIYVLFIAIVSFLTAVPVISFAPDWGDAIRNPIIGDMERFPEEIRQTYELYNIPGIFVHYLEPFKTQIYCFLASWASFSVLGLLMYLVSLIQKKSTIGIVMAGFLIFADPVIYSINGMRPEKSWIDLLSPVCWTDAGLLKDVSRKNFMSLPLAAALYIILIVLLITGIALISKNISIEIAGDQVRGE